MIAHRLQHLDLNHGPTAKYFELYLAEAKGGIAKVAKAAGIERESLYRALSPRGNPRFSTLIAVTNAIGLKLTVEPAQRAH